MRILYAIGRAAGRAGPLVPGFLFVLAVMPGHNPVKAAV